MYPYATRHPGRQSAVVFDCDGLLISTQGAWDRAYARLAMRYGTRLTSRPARPRRPAARSARPRPRRTPRLAATAILMLS